CMDFLRRLHDQGYALVDAHPGTFLFDKKGGLHVADFDYLIPQPDKGLPFEESFDITGPKPGFAGILPAGRAITYAYAWRPVLGVSLKDSMKASEKKLRVSRMVHWLLRRLPKWIFDKLPTALRPKRRPAVRDGYLVHWP